MMIIYLPLLIALIGLVMYFACKDAKPQELGRLMFFAGLLAFLLTGVGPMISLLRK